MLRVGLSHAEMRLYRRACADAHSIRVEVEVFNLDGVLRESFPQVRVMSGQVNVDRASAFTRMASLTMQHRRRTANLGLQQMIRIRYGVQVPDVGWVDAPVFTGPVTKVDESEGEVSLEAAGKEHFHGHAAYRDFDVGRDGKRRRGPGGKLFTVRKRTQKTEGIKQILRRGGETLFDFPDLPARMPQRITVGPRSVPWNRATQLADSMNRQLFFDGRGRPVLRRWPNRPCVTFHDGAGGLVLTTPQTTLSTERVRNAVHVLGGLERKPRRPDNTDDKAAFEPEKVRYAAVAPRAHPMSPWSLGLNGEPLFLPEFIENDQLRSDAEVKALANRRLDDLLRAQTTVTFDALPFPLLQEGDMVAVEAGDVDEVFRLNAFSIPLGHDGVMTLGYNKRVSVPGGGDRR